LNPAQEAPSFKLPQGTYSVVAVGNAYGKTQVKDINSTDLSQIYIQHPNWGTASAVDGHDHNYMGSKQITVPGSNK
ncbi:FimB/Mfa2 family fimbrial subunit, partial [Klebsiella pneumoniae]